MSSKFPEELLGDWQDLDRSKLYFPDFKYVDRDASLRRTWAYMQGVRNCLASPGSVIDIGAGNGAAVEIFRHFGYKVLAVDRCDREINSDFEMMLASQDVPHLRHDCSIMPYPVGDKSYDVLLAMGSLINILSKDMQRVPEALDEFSRIATKTIYLVVNNGVYLEEARPLLNSWRGDSFKLTKQPKPFIFRYDKER